MPRRIIGMHHDDRSRARRDRLLQRVKIHLPAMVVDERIPRRLYVLNAREKIKERIARRGNQNLVPGIAQQPKRVRIGFARARGQKNVVNVHIHAMLRVVFRHGLPSGNEPSRFGCVLECGGIL